MELNPTPCGARTRAHSSPSPRWRSGWACEDSELLSPPYLCLQCPQAEWDATLKRDLEGMAVKSELLDMWRLKLTRVSDAARPAVALPRVAAPPPPWRRPTATAPPPTAAPRCRSARSSVWMQMRSRPRRTCSPPRRCRWPETSTARRRRRKCCGWRGRVARRAQPSFLPSCSANWSRRSAGARRPSAWPASCARHTTRWATARTAEMPQSRFAVAPRWCALCARAAQVSKRSGDMQVMRAQNVTWSNDNRLRREQAAKAKAEAEELRSANAAVVSQVRSP